MESSEPNTPPLVMLKVPPASSSGRIFLVPRPRRQVSDGRLDLGEAKPVSPADNRNQQTAFRRDGHADVGVRVVDDLVTLDAGVHDGHFRQGEAAGLHEEGHEPELHAVCLLELFLVAAAQVAHLLHVHFVEGRERRGGVLRLHEPFGDPLAQRCHGHTAFAGCLPRFDARRFCCAQRSGRCGGRCWCGLRCGRRS